MEKKNNNKITKTFAKVLVVAFCFIQAVCLSACNGIKNFVQNTYEPPKYTDPSNKNPTTKPQQTPSDSQTPSDTETPSDIEKPGASEIPSDTETPKMPKTEEEFKVACEELLENLATYIVEKEYERGGEKLLGVSNADFNFEKGTLHFEGDIELYGGKTHYSFEAETGKLIKPESYEDAYGMFNEMLEGLKKGEIKPELSRKGSLSDDITKDKYNALLEIVNQNAEIDKILSVDNFVKTRQGSKSTIIAVKDGEIRAVYVSTNFYDASQEEIVNKILNGSEDSEFTFAVRVGAQSGLYSGLDDIGKGAEEEMGLLNKPKKILKQGANGEEWVLDFDFGLGGS